MLSSCRLFKKCLAVRFPMKNISSNFHVASMWAAGSKKFDDAEVVDVDGDKMGEAEEQQMDKSHEEEMAHQTELDAFTEQAELAEDQEGTQTGLQFEQHDQIEEHEQHLEELEAKFVDLEQKQEELELKQEELGQKQDELGQKQEELEQQEEQLQQKEEGIIYSNNEILESISDHAEASMYANEEILKTISESQIVHEQEEVPEGTAGKLLFKEAKQEQLLVDADTEETATVDYSPGKSDE